MTNIEFTMLCMAVFKLLLLYPIWFYWSITVWVGFTKECLQGLVILDFINFIILWLVTFMFALTVALCFPCVACFGPLYLVT